LEYTQTRVYWNPYTATRTRTRISMNAPWVRECQNSRGN